MSKIIFDKKTNTHGYKSYPLYNNRERIVASVHIFVGDWSAYIGKGNILDVAHWGNKVLKETAEKFFPEIAKKYMWRD